MVFSQKESARFFRVSWIIEHPDTWVVQLFTGLKDKAGKDIYEGDIMVWHKVPHLCGDYEWEEWELQGKPLRKDVLEVKWYEHRFLPFYGFGNYVPEEGEIIGNIFENGDLLKKI